MHNAVHVEAHQATEGGLADDGANAAIDARPPLLPAIRPARRAEDALGAIILRPGPHKRLAEPGEALAEAEQGDAQSTQEGQQQDGKEAQHVHDGGGNLSARQWTCPTGGRC